ncbi:MAG: hypothetical protein OXG24_12250 [Gammaproteobacteria bacterium]|nr:hypothetical protein [Gammaproteobacteria bacterium]
MSLRWLKSSLSVLVVFLAVVSFADGFVIYSSWESEWRARTDAVRTSKMLGLDAVVKPAQLSGKNWYRVVVQVNSESAEQLMLDAFDQDWDVWYLSETDSSWNVGVVQSNVEQSSMAQSRKPLFSEDGDADIVGPTPLIAESMIADDSDQSDDEIDDSTQTQSIASLNPETTGPEMQEDSEVASPSTEEPESSSSDEEEPQAEPDDVLVAAADTNDGSTLSVESTLREVEMIQRQAQDLISNWVQREDPTTYVLPTETDRATTDMQNQIPTRESWFNVLRVPERRRR